MVSLIAQDVLRICEETRIVTQSQQEKIDQLVQAFLLQPVTPEATWQFENAVEDRLRELGRNILEVVYNRLEADTPGEMPKQVEYDRQQYSRKNEKTNNRNGIGTVFGKIPLVRFSYEPLSEARDDKQTSFSPLELCLGIVAGNASPALAERVGRAASGHTQQELLEFLEREHRVRWSAKVLRRVTAAVSHGVAEHLHQAQKEQLLAWLRAADGSKGRRKITLAVGRDGIMLPIRNEKTYKEGAVATVTVYDRRGRRLGTIYLGQMPEAYQTTLSKELTRLLSELLEEWGGRWPRLVYITDAGYHPTEYFDNVLTQMEHPRHPGRLLEWTRIVDFYHASEYLAKLARVLFDDPRAAYAWQRRMRRLLKREPNAVFRILHSAAKHRSELRLTGQEEEVYRKAYQYLNNHKAHMDYREYRRLGLPIGSGITEAGCKTVFTQRFKESGMSWGIEGGGVILTLRLATMSQVWKTVYRQYLTTQPRPTIATKTPTSNQCYAKAA
ncbi:MAG: transposase [Planctomycetes bacterium]|nr:transposase [Planctomycetota bacterium]